MFKEQNLEVKEEILTLSEKQQSNHLSKFGNLSPSVEKELIELQALEPQKLAKKIIELNNESESFVGKMLDEEQKTEYIRDVATDLANNLGTAHFETINVLLQFASEHSETITYVNISLKLIRIVGAGGGITIINMFYQSGVFMDFLRIVQGKLWFKGFIAGTMDNFKKFNQEYIYKPITKRIPPENIPKYTLIPIGVTAAIIIANFTNTEINHWSQTAINAYLNAKRPEAGFEGEAGELVNTFARFLKNTGYSAGKIAGSFLSGVIIATGEKIDEVIKAILEIKKNDK